MPEEVSFVIVTEDGLVVVSGCGHRTGLEAVDQLRDESGLEPKTAAIDTVGASFELGKGLHPLALAK